MKRRAVKLCGFLLLGAIVNVAVAWAIACAPAPIRGAPADYVRYQYGDQSLLDGWVYRDIGSLYVSVIYLRGNYTPRADRDDIPAFIQRQPGFARRNILAWLGNVEAPAPPSHDITVIGRGWPIPALYSIEEEDGRRKQPGTRAQFIDRGAIVIPSMTRRNTGNAPFYAIALPVRPIWPGFAINTLFYAAILCGGWLLLAVPFALRRRRRIRRALCPKCAYPVGDSPVCTECGAAMRLGNHSSLPTGMPQRKPDKARAQT